MKTMEVEAPSYVSARVPVFKRLAIYPHASVWGVLLKLCSHIESQMSPRGVGSNIIVPHPMPGYMLASLIPES
jgi:hypothetical protein